MKTQSGKIAHSSFKEFLQGKCGKQRKEVAVGPQFGVDVSVINLANGQAMAVASDPLSLIPTLGLKESAWLSVHLVANDIATTGSMPMYGQFILNLPAHLSQKDFQIYWNYIHQFCDELGVAITGGHTGFIEGQNSTIAGGGTLITIADKNKLLASKNARPGNTILVTKGCALSSVAILAKSFPETVKNNLGNIHYNNACDLFYDISVTKDAQAVMEIENQNDITAMHDVTEGGVLGAIYELVVASGNGASIYNEQLPISETQNQVCELFSLDPRYTLGAGAMIITCNNEAVAAIKSSLRKANISCEEVGKIETKEKGIKLFENNRKTEIEYHEKDPYWNAFFKAIELEWK